MELHHLDKDANKVLISLEQALMDNNINAATNAMLEVHKEMTKRFKAGDMKTYCAIEENYHTIVQAYRYTKD